MFWKLEEGRLIQERGYNSAANATNVSFVYAPVPEGKVWVVLGFAYKPSVAETKIVGFSKILKSTSEVAVLNPISLALNPMSATFIEQGMEYVLFPGEYIKVYRDSATAGSTMTITMQIIEIDLPLYTYEDPQEVKRQRKVATSVLNRLGGGLGGGSVTRPPTLTGERGGRGGPLEK